MSEKSQKIWKIFVSSTLASLWMTSGSSLLRFFGIVVPGEVGLKLNLKQLSQEMRTHLLRKPGNVCFPRHFDRIAESDRRKPVIGEQNNKRQSKAFIQAIKETGKGTGLSRNTLISQQSISLFRKDNLHCFASSGSNGSGTFGRRCFDVKLFWHPVLLVLLANLE